MLAQQDGSVIDSLPSVKVPTLVLVGADDERFLAAADYMALTVPDATKVVLPDAGHAANIDQPEAFNAAVIEFLDKHA
jgi:pimeloyl-ACP methyl ester carboxylesterase